MSNNSLPSGPTRPRFADFEPHVGSAFAVTGSDGQRAGKWTLINADPLDSPDIDGLRDLECFSLLFRHDRETPIREQGLFVLRCDDNIDFEQTVFAIPCSPTEMAVTVN
ncbi:MAG: hypothetical protein AAGJ79_05065 [Verrucomicrobiota bacterium]